MLYVHVSMCIHVMYIRVVSHVLEVYVNEVYTIFSNTVEKHLAPQLFLHTTGHAYKINMHGPIAI